MLPAPITSSANTQMLLLNNGLIISYLQILVRFTQWVSWPSQVGEILQNREWLTLLLLQHRKRSLIHPSTLRVNSVRRSNFGMLRNVPFIDVWKGMCMTVNIFCTLIPMPGTILNVSHGLIISSPQPCEGDSIILILEENPAVCSGNHPS